MPVRRTVSQIRCWVAAFLLLPAAAFAQEGEAKNAAPAQVLIKSAEQLANDREVRKQREPYQLATSIVYIHQECGKELGLSEAQKQFAQKKFAAASDAYLAAFEAAYQHVIRAPSSAELKQDFARYLRAQQQPVINDTASAIRARGCDQNSIESVVKYFDKLQAAESPTTTGESPPEPSPQPAATPETP